MFFICGDARAEPAPTPGGDFFFVDARADRTNTRTADGATECAQENTRLADKMVLHATLNMTPSPVTTSSNLSTSPEAAKCTRAFSHSITPALPSTSQSHIQLMLTQF